jgi:diguanylate cyclase (GGDEF)-like protein/PAS domain S-box-containing protein
MPASIHHVTFRRLICIALGLIGLAVIAIGITVWALRGDAIRQASTEANNIASVLAEQTSRSFQAIDLVATDIEEKFSTQGPVDYASYIKSLESEDTWNYLIQQHFKLPQVDVIGLIDRDGFPVNNTRSWPSPQVNLYDREYFQYQKNNINVGLHVSALLRNRVSGEPSLFLSKRLQGENNQFLGIILITVKLSYFEHIYNSTASIQNRSITFLRNDGKILLRHPDPQQVSGRVLPHHSQWYDLLEKGRGQYRSIREFSDEPDLVAFRQVRNYPLTVNVAISEHAALAIWRHRATLIAAGTALAVLCSLLLLYFLNGQYRRILRSEESLAEREARLSEKTVELKDVNKRIDYALNNMLQGLAMFDSQTRMVICNRQYLEMYGLSSDVVREGTTLRRILEHRTEIGAFFGNIPEYVGQVMRMLATGQPMVTFTELPDGRTFCVTNKPTGDGGWVATHQDVTERRKSDNDLKRTRNFLDAVIDNVPETLVVKTASDGRYVLANKACEKFYGISRDEILGKTAFDIFAEREAKIISDRDQHALERGNLTVEDYSFDMSKTDRRFVTSKRVAIPGADGTPDFLLTILSDVTQRKQNEQRISHLAHHDPLTDLPNRAAFNARLAAKIEAAKASGEKIALICTDLDRFKEINDLLGHAAGDSVLLEIARRLKTVAGDAFLARLGGDEFPIIVSGPQPDTAKHMAARLIAAMAEDMDYEGRKFRPGISVGIAVFPDDGSDAATLLRNADAALYRAKSEGRGIIRFYEAEMDKLLHDRRALQNDLAVAIEKKELLLHYQPQARVSGQIIGFEALLRWNHAVRGSVPPDTFIPLAEENGTIVAIGEWVLREACREAASWPKPLQIAVNLSPVQFRHGDLVGLVHAVLLETGLVPERLVLEITEGALMDDYSRAVSILRRLKSLGVRIAMDDFGTGYSSLSYLQSFPFDKIKIDRTFISNLERNNQSAAIVRAVLGLGQKLNLTVVAEGVENNEQLTILRHERCDEMQGYLIGRPTPISEYPELVGRRAALEKRIAAI